MATYELTPSQFEEAQRRILGALAREFIYVRSDEQGNAQWQFNAAEHRPIASVQIKSNPFTNKPERYTISTDNPEIQRQIEGTGIRPMTPTQRYELTPAQFEELRDRTSQRYGFEHVQNGEWKFTRERSSVASVQISQNSSTNIPKIYTISTDNPEMQRHLREMGIRPIEAQVNQPERQRSRGQ